MGWTLLDMDYVAQRGQKLLDKELKEGSEEKQSKYIDRKTQQLAILKDDAKKGSALRIHWMDVHGDIKLSYNLAKAQVMMKCCICVI